MKLFVATHNQHKIREISQILPGFEIVPDDPEGVEENAPDFAGNALIKVRAIAEKHKGEWCMADDSGLEMTPVLRSRRSEARRESTARAMRASPATLPRTTRFFLRTSRA